MCKSQLSVADGPAPTWCQIICNHHYDEGQSVHFKKARTDASYNASKYIGQSTTPDQPCQLMVRTRSKEILNIDVETKWPPFPDDIFKGIFVNENVWIWLNTLRPRQNGRRFADDLSNAFSWMKMLEFRLSFHWSLFLSVQLTIIQHWFR